MCGRFTQTFSSSEITKVFNLDGVPAIEPKYNIAPTQQVATILRSDPSSDRQFQMLRWGLIPSWAKDLKSRSPQISSKHIL